MQIEVFGYAFIPAEPGKSQLFCQPFSRRVSMTFRATEGAEPFPGYVLIKRLGTGGFGEVWHATAPGGLAKAVKIIYGNISDSRAEQELRALSRIREVRHPFLLSLD